MTVYMMLIHMMLYNIYMWCQKNGVKYGFGVFCHTGLPKVTHFSSY